MPRFGPEFYKPKRLKVHVAVIHSVYSVCRVDCCCYTWLSCASMCVKCRLYRSSSSLVDFWIRQSWVWTPPPAAGPKYMPNFK